MIRWAYENKKGTVSEPLQFGNKFIVASLTDIKEKGIAPLEEVKDDVNQKVVKEKKAELFTTEFNSTMGAGIQIDAIAAKMKLKVEQAQKINFNSTTIPGAGNQPYVIGEVSVQKAKTISKPLVDKEGVFLVYAESVAEAPVQKDYKAQQASEMAQLQPRVDYDVYDALKANANIVDHLFKFY